MAGNRLHDLYATLLAGDDLPPELHVAIWEYAVARGDEELLAALVARPDSPPRLRARFAKLSPARLRAAFLSRPDVDAEEAAVELALESREEVLVAVAANRGTSASVLELLGASDLARVAFHLAGNYGAPVATRARAVATLAAQRGRLPDTRWYQLQELVRTAGELHETLARTLDDTELLLLVAASAGSGLSPVAQRRLVEVLVGAHLPDEGDQRRRKSSRVARTEAVETGATNAVFLLQNRVLGVDAIQHLHELFTGRELHPQTQARLDDAFGEHRPDPVEARRELARTSADAHALADLVAEVDTDVDLAEALARNPHLPTAAGVALLPMLDVDTALELLAYHPGDDELALAACRTQPPLISRGGLSRFADPEAAAEELANHFASLRRPLRELGFAHLAEAGALSTERLRTLSWRFVCEQSTLPAVARQVGELLRSTFGVDPEPWGALAEAGDSFSGRVGDLVDRCAATVARPAPG